MAYTKYSLTPANNNATPPDGAPEGMLPSAVNDTMRDMMAQIRDVGDGIRNGTYTMTAPVITGGSITGVALSGNTFTNPVITGGSINNTPIGASTANTGAFTTLSASGATTFSGATVVSGSLTANTFSSSGATITGGSINNTPIGASTANTGAFTTLSASGATTFSGATVVSGSLTANTFSSSGATITGGSINSTAIGGTTAAAGKFTTLEATGVTTVQAGTVSAPAITTSGDTNTGCFFPAADTIALTTGGTERMRIDSSGNLLVGTTSNPNSKKFVVGGGVNFLDAAGNGAVNFVQNKGTGATNSGAFGLSYTTVDYTPSSASSNIYWDGGTGYFTLSTSARKYKRNITPVTNEQLDKALTLKPSYYQRLEYDYWEYGFIAEEVSEAGLDEFVARVDGEISGLNYEKMVTLAFGLIQRQEKQIQELKQEVAALKASH